MPPIYSLALRRRNRNHCRFQYPARLLDLDETSLERVAQEFAVVVVCEAMQGFAGIEPFRAVDLVAIHLEGTAGWFHQKIMHDFRSWNTSLALISVTDAGQRTNDAAIEAGLFADLAECGLLDGFAGVGFALGKRPIVIFCAVNNQDLTG